MKLVEVFCTERTVIKLQDARERGETLFQIMHSDYRWRKVRKVHLKVEPCCQMCQRRKKLEVHHIQPWHMAFDLRYDPDNLVTLCRECHFRFGHFQNWHNYNPEILRLCSVVQEIVLPYYEQEIAA
jgi:hypothetical protein